ncbi:hypothetical protein CMV_015459 [Castanea mollissima]|uniref:Uncharacterized protein n=1 Tax=Castanea mollissima TaxID=60419 RepID=A0A8J4VTC0_9ROSI|nr:hypothetical protein CMV_015459 [Castanea mollissima]
MSATKQSSFCNTSEKLESLGMDSETVVHNGGSLRPTPLALIQQNIHFVKFVALLHFIIHVQTQMELRLHSGAKFCQLKGQTVFKSGSYITYNIYNSCNVA